MVKRAELQFLSLPKEHQALLPGVITNLTRISECANFNDEVLQAIVNNSIHMFENIEYGDRVRLYFLVLFKLVVGKGFIVNLNFSFSYIFICLLGRSKETFVVYVWHGQTQIHY